MQGRRHQIWGGQVRSVCISTLQLGGIWGHGPPEIFGNLEVMTLLLRLFLGQYDASRKPHNRVWIFTLSAHCVVQHWFRLSDRSLISQATPFADEACETNRSLGRRISCWKTRKSTFALFAAISQASRKCHENYITLMTLTKGHYATIWNFVPLLWS